MNLFKAISAQARLRAAVCAAVGPGTLSRRKRAAWPAGVLPQRLCDPAVIAIYAVRQELHHALHTRRLPATSAAARISVAGMFLNLRGIGAAAAIGRDGDLVCGAAHYGRLCRRVSRERVRLYRWSAVAIGFSGVLVMLWPYFDIAHYAATASNAATIGASCALLAAFTNAGSVIQTRGSPRPKPRPRSCSILTDLRARGLATMPFGWIVPNAPQLAALIGLGVVGGLAHVLLESYRHAPASLIAPFDYSSIAVALCSMRCLARLPTVYVFVGAAIVTGAGCS